MKASLASAALVSALGCKPAMTPSKPLTELTPQETSGHAIYQSRCAGCHNTNSEKPLHGPGLLGLYRKTYLPSGAPANDDRVSTAIVHGRGMMPAFGNDLDERQLSDLIAYLHTL